MKKILFLIVLVSFCGCATAKGFFGGLGDTAWRTGKGIKQDLKVVPKSVKKADNWVNENVW